MQRAFIGVGADAAESEARRAKNTEKIAFLLKRRFYEMAEMERFELSNRDSRLHDFQSCALDQLGDISLTFSRLTVYTKTENFAIFL